MRKIKKKKVIQPEVNIGVIGHVDHGKTSVVRALTNEWTDKHSEEIKRGITIKLGYADASFYYCEKSKKYNTKETCEDGRTGKLVRKVSFVDCPGHESLMAVMMSGASLMDGALLIIAANEKCPQPQTIEHLSALEIAGIKNIVIVQNKIDLVSKEEALKNYEEIKQFVKGTIAEKAPIIPFAAHYNANVSELIEALEKTIPTPKRDTKKPFRMLIARSFDINKPSSKIDNLKGGVIGGSIIQGVVKEGEEIEIAPGMQQGGKYKNLVTKVASLSIKDGFIKEAKPGGLVAIGTTLDPSLTKGDNLIGNTVGKPGTLPPVRNDVTVEYHLLKQVVGLGEVKNITAGEVLVINGGTLTTVGVVKKADSKKAFIELKKPLCIETGEKVGISRKGTTRWCLIGYGIVIE